MSKISIFSKCSGTQNTNKPVMEKRSKIRLPEMSYFTLSKTMNNNHSNKL